MSTPAAIGSARASAGPRPPTSARAAPAVPFELVQATLAAVAAGELEEAFERWFEELPQWGVRRGCLYVAEGELHRVAGEPVDPKIAHRLTLYDGYDVVGELELELDGNEPPELLELLQDLFGLGIGRHIRTNQLDLVNAAVAVNSAGSLDEALDALADACRRITRTPNALVIVWEPDLSRGRVRAASGDAVAAAGETVDPGRHAAYRAASSAQVTLARTGGEDGVGSRLREVLGRYHCSLAVPLMVEGAPPITFQVAWPAEPKPLAVEQAISAVQRLGALTSVAFRAAEERARIAQSALLRSVIEVVPDGIIISKGGEEMLNAAARRMHGVGVKPFRREDLMPRWPDGSPLDPADYPSAVCRRTGAEARVRCIVRIDGEDRVFDVKSVPMSDGYVSVVRDVTEEHAEHALTRESLDRLFQSLPIAAIVLDAENGAPLRVNAAFEALVGFTLGELVASRKPHPWCDNLPSLERLGPDPVDAVYRHKDGRAVPVELLQFTVRVRDGAPAQRVQLARDMTERHAFDRQLIQSGKLAAIGELASGVAHEINNPLFAILGLTEFLLREADEGTKTHERLLLIQQTGLEIKEIVKALLDFARERIDDHRPLLLREVVGETVELVRRATAVKDVEIVERYADGPTEVVGSPNQIKQVVLNLITNAQQAMPDGGTITVTVEEEGDWMVATVSDTGPGIEPDVLQRLFEPFFTTKRDVGGTGLGLAVSHGIAQMHGGALTAESSPGEGAVFRLRLPRAPETS